MASSPARRKVALWVRVQRSLDMVPASAATAAALIGAATVAHPQAAWLTTAPSSRQRHTSCQTRTSVPTIRSFVIDYNISLRVSQSRRWNSNVGGDDQSVPVNDDDSTQETDEFEQHVKRVTLDWVRRVVIGLNLCPFAERPLKDGKLKIHVVHEKGEVEVMSHVLYQAIARQDVPGTTLVVAPYCFPNDFESFLSVIKTLEQDMMSRYYLDGDVQIAPFHPRFEFEGSGVDGIDNWTNKSPFPIFHLLREEEVSRAVEALDGDAGKVWKRNVGLLQDLQDEFGVEGVEQIMSGNTKSNANLRNTLMRHRIKLSDTKPSSNQDK